MPNTKSSRSALLKNKHFKEYDKKREKIIQKYSAEDWKEKQKEIASLIFHPESDFQKFLWDTMPEVEKVLMERRARGRRKGSEEPRIEIE